MVDILPYVFAGITIAGLVFSGISYYINKKRSDSISKLARDLGFSYEKKAAEDMLFADIVNKISGESQPKKSVENFMPDSEILKWGDSRSVENLISGKINEREWKAFDYNYTTRSGRSSYRHRQTIFVSRIYGIVPSFVLDPEGFFEKIGDLVLKQDIDFDNYPEFSKKYFLKCQDKTAIKLLFTPELISQIEKAQGKIAVQSDGKIIAFFTPEKKDKPEDWSKQIEEASKIFNLIDPKKKSF